MTRAGEMFVDLGLRSEESCDGFGRIVRWKLGAIKNSGAPDARF